MSVHTLPQEIHVGVYRILQEQLNNVLKHAEASHVFVELKGSAEAIQLVVSDNGKGFAINGKKAGIGLMNMRTRAENLNGSFVLNSTPGAGCTLEVVIPVPGGSTVPRVAVSDAMLTAILNDAGD